MSDKALPGVRVRFTVVNQGNTTLRDLILFAQRLESIGAGDFLDMPLHGLNHTMRPYVEGVAPAGGLGTETADDLNPDPVLQRIREELANYNANRIGQDTLVHRIEQIVGKVEWADPGNKGNDDED